MSAAWIAIIAISVATLAVILFQFAARPIMQFVSLRAEVARRVRAFKQTREIWSSQRHDSDSAGADAKGRADEAERNLRAAQIECRELAEQMRLFGTTEPLASWMLRLLGYDPMIAYNALSQLADAIALERREYLRQNSENGSVAPSEVA